MARLLFRLGAGAFRHRLAVALVWAAVLAAGVAGALTLAGETSDAFSIPGQESTTALERIAEEFGAGGGATAQVVVRAPEGQTLSTPEVGGAVGRLVADVSGLPGVTSATDPFDAAAPTVDRQLTTAYSTVTYGAPVGEVTVEQQEALLDAVAAARDGGLTVEVAGDAVTEPPHVGGPAEAIGVVLALVVLALTYGTLVTAGMNLLTALVGVAVGILGITITTGFTELSSTTPTLAAMLGLAVGIDYALFIINRCRQELRSGADVPTAVATAVGTAGSAVLVAGLTVVIALAGLSVVGIPFLTQMGVAAAATVVVAVLVAVTLVPAVLGFLGLRVLPRRQRDARHAAVTSTGPDALAARGLLARWAGTVTSRPALSLVAAVVALGVVAVPVASMQTTLVQTPVPGTTQARAQALLEDGFGAGANGPLTVLVTGDGAVEAAAGARGALARLDDVVLVTEPVPGPSGRAALLSVVPESGPATAATEALVADLRAELAALPGVETAVTGATAVSVDVAETLDAALPVYLTLVVGLALVLLVLVFRSLLVPLVGVLGFLLTTGASLGATVAVFSWGWLGALVNLDGTGPLLSLTPILVIGILFGLAMDYQVFLVSRMHEAHSHGAAPLAAVRTGFRQAAPVVVAAAAIMLSVFAGFVPSGEATIKSIAFALAVGIAVDAFVVRMVLVPAALSLLGERAWWLPRWLAWLPVLDVEGEGLRAAPPSSAPAAAVGAGSR